jgi:dihydroorotase
MHALHKSGCIAVSNVREGMNNDETLLRCLEYAASLELTVFFYPEEPSLANGCAHDGFTASRLGLPSIPAVAETVALAKQLLLVEETGVRAHFGQLSCKSSVELIRIAKAKGLAVTADVAMHQLHLTDAAIDGFNSLAHVRPPLRSETDRLALCAACNQA